MQCTNLIARGISFTAILALAGCVSVMDVVDGIVDTTIDQTFETQEERHVRDDTTRWRQGKPMRHHGSESELLRHREDLRFQECKKERYLDDLRSGGRLENGVYKR